ncbi:MAG TPA: hypothetical protein VH414_13920 [Lichenihabitans sp.]|nr:hypothetical protein [Lichenihabitans sp.]
MLAIARNVIWFEEPERALAEPFRFMAYLMTYGTAEEIETVRRHVGRAAFVEVMDHIPPGIMDARSWAYWNVMAGRYPPPPLPRRVLP